jgi:hypothetical protein
MKGNIHVATVYPKAMIPSINGCMYGQAANDCRKLLLDASSSQEEE